ncbi:MAG: hypothetical protein ACHP78_00315 [Terriglobales bacterium]
MLGEQFRAQRGADEQARFADIFETRWERLVLQLASAGEFQREILALPAGRWIRTQGVRRGIEVF